jgi:methanogenic corrinoid protein MtbC1
MEERLAKGLVEAFNEYDDDAVIEIIDEALEAGVNPLEVLDIMSKALEDIGVSFSNGDLFLPDMIMAGEVMTEAMNTLKPAIMANDDYVPSGRKIVIGTVSGDLHDIGKNMVKMMFVSSGYDVVDLGTNVSAETFYNAANDENPDIIAISSCMSTTVPNMKDTIDLLRAKGLHEKHKIVVGGGSANETLADELGAYCYGGDDAYQALKKIKQLFA